MTEDDEGISSSGCSISDGVSGEDEDDELMGPPSVGVPSSDEEDDVGDDEDNGERWSSVDRGGDGDDARDLDRGDEVGVEAVTVGKGGSGSGQQRSSGSGSKSLSRWVVAFGFPIVAAAGDGAGGAGRTLGDVATSVLRQFDSCGEVIRRFRPGGPGGPDLDAMEGGGCGKRTDETAAVAVAVNWVAIKFATASQAEAALGRNASIMRLGDGTGTLIVGVCRLNGTMAEELGLPTDVLYDPYDDDGDDDDEDDDEVLPVEETTATDDDSSSDKVAAEDGPSASVGLRLEARAKTTTRRGRPRSKDDRRTGARRSSSRSGPAPNKGGRNPAPSPGRRGRPLPKIRVKRGAATTEDAGTDGRKRPTKRRRRGPPLPVDRLIETLTDGWENDRPRGWYRRQLGLNPRLAEVEAEGGGRRVALNEAEKVQILTEVNMLEQYLSDGNNVRRAKRSDDGSGRFAKADDDEEGEGNTRYHPVTKRYLVQVAWGKGNSYINDLQKAVKMARNRMGIAEDDPVTPSPMMLVRNMTEAKRMARGGQRSVIDDIDLASKIFTPDYLYAVSECRRMAMDDDGPIIREEHKARLVDAKRRYRSLDDDTKSTWEARREEHLRLQPSMRQRLVDAMHADPNFTWRGLEVAIDHWCSDSTIKRWVSGLRGFEGRRSKRTLPEEFL